MLFRPESIKCFESKFGSNNISIVDTCIVSCKCTQLAQTLQWPKYQSSWCIGLQEHPLHSEDVSYSLNCVFLWAPQHFPTSLSMLSSTCCPEWRRDRCLIFIAVLAKPISEEDVDWNVTNPSVLVWICMLIWSNGPSGDRAMEQFNHAISDRSSAAYLWWVPARRTRGCRWYISHTGRGGLSCLFEINCKWWIFEKLISPQLKDSSGRFAAICIAANVRNESLTWDSGAYAMTSISFT